MSPNALLDMALGQADDIESPPPTPDVIDRANRLEIALSQLLDDGMDTQPPFGLAHRTLLLVEKRGERPSTIEQPAARRPYITWKDLAVAAAVCVGSLLVLMPALHRARLQSATQWCADNLRQIGMATVLKHDVRQGPRDRWTTPGAHTPAAHFVSLLDQGFLDHPKVFDCPSGGAHPEWDHHQAGIPLLQSTPGFNSECDYAMHLGCRDAAAAERIPEDIRLKQTIPLIADRPDHDKDGRPSAWGNSPNHGGSGQNVFRTDGSVIWARTRAVSRDNDIYLNQDGQAAPGLHHSDGVLVPPEFRCSEEY